MLPRRGGCTRTDASRAVSELPDIVGTNTVRSSGHFPTPDGGPFRLSVTTRTDAPFPPVQLTGPRRRTAPVSGCALHTRRRGPCPDERLQFPGAPAGHGDAKRRQGTIAGPARAPVLPQRRTHRELQPFGARAESHPTCHLPSGPQVGRRPGDTAPGAARPRRGAHPAGACLRDRLETIMQLLASPLDEETAAEVTPGTVSLACSR